MNTKKLKELVLDLAIHGKLVPQDPNDEPASVLLERIRNEKERLVKEGKIKKSKSTTSSDTPPYENVPFEVPSGWCWCRGNGIFHPMESIKPSGDVFKYIDIDSIDNKLNKITPKLIDVKNAPSRATRKTQKGDILFSMVRPYLRNIAQVDEDECIASTGFFVCKPKEVLSSDYCFYMMISAYVVDGLNSYMKGDNSPSINNQHIQNWAYPLPPLAEQQRIVTEIERWFDVIDALEANEGDLQKTIEQAKKKILDLAIRGKLVPQDPNDEPAGELLKKLGVSSDNRPYENVPFEVPKSWCWTTLGNISNYGSCTTVDVKSISEDAWILELEDIEKDTARILQRLSKSQREIKGVRHIFNEGVVLYSKLRTYLNKVLVAPEDGYSTTEIIPIEPEEGVDPKYLVHVLRSKYFLDYTAQCGYGVKMPRLSTSDARKSLIPLPPLAEQQRIVAKIEELYKQLDAIATSLQA